MAGYEIPLVAVRQQISRAINLIIQMKRSSEGIRQVCAITEVSGFENGQVVLQDVFVMGRHKVTGQQGCFPTGHQPAFIRTAPASGVMVPGNLFTMPSGLSAPPPIAVPSPITPPHV
jgi:pilus assembly protein CpaF